MDEARDMLQEAREILAGTTIMIPETAHLAALMAHHENTVEAYECRIIKLVNMLEVAKREVLNG